MGTGKSQVRVRLHHVHRCAHVRYFFYPKRSQIIAKSPIVRILQGPYRFYLGR